MNAYQALQLAQQRHADLRADRARCSPRRTGASLSAESLRTAPQSAAASAARARRATGWFLVAVGLRLAVAGETARQPALTGPAENSGIRSGSRQMAEEA